MTPRYRVALVGFSPFEQQALESYFRLAGGQSPAFEPAPSLGDSDFCVVDGDRPAAVEEVRAAGRMDGAVFIGQQVPAGAVMHLHRPIDARQVARALETLMLARQAVADPYAPRPAAVRPAKKLRPVAEAHFDIDVLVVDDTDIARRFLQVQLEKFGCRVTVAASAEEALAKIAQARFRVVFGDVQMQDMDGLALCQQIKQRRKGAPTVVLISSQVTPSDRVRATIAGADGFLAKPIDANELVAVLRSCSNRRRRAR
ncbi:response regulator [Methylibium sp.]|uniref:response regulator n=1 Tax=Methylibium sp. TaxID=2067992 RepID=UPI003D0AEAAC